MYQEHIRALINAWNTGDVTGIENYLAENVIRESPPTLSDMTVNNIGEMKELVAGFRSAFPDLKVTLEEEMYGEGVSFNKWTCEGTNTGPGETEPTGRHFKIEGASIQYYEDGKMVHEKIYFDTASFMSQLGMTNDSQAASS